MHVSEQQGHALLQSRSTFPEEVRNGGLHICDVPLEYFEAVRSLLQSCTLDEYLRRRPPSHVVTLDVRATVSEALTTLATYNILSAPLVDAAGRSYYGFLDRADLLKCVLRDVEVRRTSAEDRYYRLHSEGCRIAPLTLSQVRPGDDGEIIYKANGCHTLFEVCRYGFMHKHGGGHVTHRVAVFDFVDEGSRRAAMNGGGDDDDEDDDCSSIRARPRDAAADPDACVSASSDDDDDSAKGKPPAVRITHIVSQSDFIRFLHAHTDACGPVMGVSVEALGLAHKPVVCVPCDMPAINAFATMDACEVSSVGIIDQRSGGRLVGNLSASDFRGLLPSQFGLLSLPVVRFVQLRLGCPGGGEGLLAKPPEGLASSADWGLKAGCQSGKTPRLLAVKPGHTLGDVVDCIVKEKVHRVYVVDDRDHALGIITITDILGLFIY